MHLLHILIWFLSLAVEAEKTPVHNIVPTDAIEQLYKDCGLEGKVNPIVFRNSLKGIQLYRSNKSILSIVDFSLPSDQKRFYVIDLKSRKLLLSTWVAHGKNSGLRMAEFFSNKFHSHQSSPGFYHVGSRLISPKHGLALQLVGLEKGVNDNAKEREIIIHGAPYVSQEFINKNGRCGRSFGCPALPLEMMPKVAPLLANGSLLYIFVPGKAK